MIPQNILRDEKRNRELVDALEGQERKKIEIVSVDEYPTGLTDKLTVLWHRGDHKILLCDTIAWYQAQLTPMESD